MNFKLILKFSFILMFIPFLYFIWCNSFYSYQLKNLISHLEFDYYSFYRNFYYKNWQFIGTSYHNCPIIVKAFEISTLKRVIMKHSCKKFLCHKIDKNWKYHKNRQKLIKIDKNQQKFTEIDKNSQKPKLSIFI